MKVSICIGLFLLATACIRAPFVVDETVETNNPFIPSTAPADNSQEHGNEVDLNNSLNLKLCQATWEESPGYADYTTINWWSRAGGQSFGNIAFDRKESQTLQGRSDYIYAPVCTRAKILKPCFEKSVVLDERGNAPTLIQWFRNRNLNPVIAKMAFAMKETGLGKLHDSCTQKNGKPSCNGVGLMQIITAITPSGESLADTDKRWAGISFNILTNLLHSSRIMQQKLPATDLESLASNYNGHPDLQLRVDYGIQVTKWYHQIQSCRF